MPLACPNQMQSYHPESDPGSDTVVQAEGEGWTNGVAV